MKQRPDRSFVLREAVVLSSRQTVPRYGLHASEVAHGGTN